MPSNMNQQIDKSASGANGSHSYTGNILVVDDEIELKAVLVESLIAQGFEATGYSSGRDALNALQVANFDLLLTDLMMPDMDGITLLQAALEIDPDLVTLVRGTAFKVYLPRVSEAEEEKDVAIGAKAVPRGTETVLLVEDEDHVRDILTDILNDQGYRVFVASSGSEALDIARKNGIIHLMVTDVVMPQMSGRELAENLTQDRPEMKVLYMSGYTDDAIVRHGLLDEKLHFLQKPFDSVTVARKVRQVLDSQT